MSEPQRLGRLLPGVAAALATRPGQRAAQPTGVVRVIEDELMALAPRMLRRRLPDPVVERLASVLVEGVRVVVADERSRGTAD